MLFINSSKLSSPRSFPMSITWGIFVGWLLSLSFTLTDLFQNHVEWMLPSFFNCLHLQDSWWFSRHMLSETKSLPEKLSWLRPSDLSSAAKDATSLYPTFTWRLLVFTSWPIRDNALQTLFSRTSSSIEVGTGFISNDSWRWYCALLIAFLSNWIILSRLQFLVTVSSEKSISYHLRKSSKRLVRSDSLEDIYQLVNSFFLWKIFWLAFCSNHDDIWIKMTI